MPALNHSSLEELERAIRSALAHLYDSAFLQTHPLTRLIDAQTHWDALSRAQHLRRTLLDGIETLRPSADRPTPIEAARAYAVLTYRYVDSLPMDEISEKLALSRRQVYREHEKGIHAIARLFADRSGLDTSRPHSNEVAAVPIASGANPMQSEIERLRSTARRDALTVRHILDGVLTLLRPMAEDSSVALSCVCEAENLCVVGDRIMLRQALIALLTHAIDSAIDDVRIEVTSHTTSVDIAVTTTLQPDAVSVSDEMHVLTELIDAQHGHTVVQRSEAQWRACITLPSCASTTLLVIDDNADLVELFRRYLAGHRVDVVGASDGRLALELAAELSPSLITVDVMMPGIDGWEMLQHLKGSPGTRHIPIVVCSVLHEARLAQSMGAVGYLTKPINQREFLDMARRWLGPLQPAD